METDDAGAVQANYTYGNDLVSMNIADTNAFYLYDGLGSTRQLTADNQTVVASYTYDSFGDVIASSGSVNNVYGFTGEQQFNEADSLVFLRARYYDSRVGRFISRDPSGYTDSMNLYMYVLNDPVVLTDPMGLMCFYLKTEVSSLHFNKFWTTGFCPPFTGPGTAKGPIKQKFETEINIASCSCDSHCKWGPPVTTMVNAHASIEHTFKWGVGLFTCTIHANFDMAVITTVKIGSCVAD